VETRSEGDRLTEHGMPRNAVRVFSSDLYALGTTTGELSSNSIPAYRGPSRLREDVEGQIRDLEDEKRQRSQAMEVLAREIQQIESEMSRLDQTQRDTSRSRQLDQRLLSIEAGISEEREKLRDVSIRV
jgi:chromosome segregation ATPase